MKFNLKLFFLWILMVETLVETIDAFTVESCDDDEIGNPCKLEKNESGIIKVYNNCEFAKKSALNFTALNIITCNRKRPPTKSLFCCPITMLITIPNRHTFRVGRVFKDEQIKPVKKPENVADLKCKNFGKRPYAAIINDHIVGGKEAEPAEFPHFGEIGYDKPEASGYDWSCGSVLISENFVLTAAHCVADLKRVPKVVRFGKVTLDNTDPSDPYPPVDIEVAEIIKQPNYKVGDHDNDIALIRLETSVNFSANIFPACLTVNNTEDPIMDLIISGFGKDMKKDKFQSGTLKMMKATVNETSTEDCKEKYSNHDMLEDLKLREGITNENWICAWAQGVDTCQGDSGSGLMRQVGKKFYVYGITSFGAGCGSLYPSFYTRVSKHLAWIVDNVWSSEE